MEKRLVVRGIPEDLGNSRDLPYGELRDALKLGNVWFDGETPYRPG